MAEVYTSEGGEDNGKVHRLKRVGETRSLTDLGNAERFVDDHKRYIRYCYAWGRWLIFDGRRWATDDDGEVERKMKRTVRGIYAEAEMEADDARRRQINDHARRSEAKARQADALFLARSELSIRPEEMDTDPYLLNCANGTVDLKTGVRRDHDRLDYITKLAPVHYHVAAPAPVFDAFLTKILPSLELRQFVQAVVGYAAIGANTEEILPIFHGSGANGKSTLANAVMEALGDYAQQAAPDLLMAKHGAHPTELADLFGARFVAAVETDEGRRLNEGLVKQLTGRDKIKARRMREDFWQFDPTHTPILATNHKPEVRGTDHAIWRRLKLVPFDVQIPADEQDKKLSEKLREELPGVLAWIVRGALIYQRIGLPEAKQVSAATSGYRAEMDTLAAFFEDRCVVHPRTESPATPLYNAYKSWCDENGESGESQRRFGARLRERGFESFTYTAGPHRDRKGWRGIGLRDDRHDDDPGDGGNHPRSSASADDQTVTSTDKGGQEAHNTPKTGGDRPQRGQSSDDCPHVESRIGMGETPNIADVAEDHGPIFGINSFESLRVAVMPKQGPHRPHGPQTDVKAPRESRLTTKQAERVKRLIAEGMAASFARAEVLAADHPPGCECEVCL